jgi:hypothetical protein
MRLKARDVSGEKGEVASRAQKRPKIGGEPHYKCAAFRFGKVYRVGR